MLNRMTHLRLSFQLALADVSGLEAGADREVSRASE